MPLIWGLLLNNKQLAVALVLGALGLFAFGTEHALYRHEAREVVKLRSELAAANQAGLAQSAAAAQATALQKEHVDVIESQLTSAYAAHGLTASALRDAVVRYQNARGACAVPATGPGAGGDLGARPGAGAARSTGGVIAALITACQHDADQLKACQAYASSCAAK